MRHVLDSTWASMCLVRRKQPCHGIDPVLSTFLSSITPYDKLSLQQKAAVLVLQGRFSDDEGERTGSLGLGGKRKHLACGQPVDFCGTVLYTHPREVTKHVA